MILPDKYITLTESFIGLSALILDILLKNTLTIDKLWIKFKKKYINSKKIKNPLTYEKFIYVLEFMYICSMISYNDRGEIFNENLKSKN